MENAPIQQVDIDQQMRSAYLDYAMSVIVARALPDARDGLKPVHRRILYAMNDLGMRSNSAYKKSARIVGEVLGKYHPHGDSSVYDAMARMVQDFSMRYPLVDGQGNFGSVDGDAPAAMRYTEARMDKLAEEMMQDIDKNTVDFADNFDGSLKEPVVLPARLPNLLLNGSSGIAVGMATNIPPHNLRELVNALTYLIDHFENIEDVSTEELMEFLPGPDFPTGGIIIGRESIRQMYSTGRGKLTIRGVAHIEELKNGRNAIFITELPYQVNKSVLISRIADLVHEGKIDAISDLRDESDRRGMSIYVELKRNAQPKKVLNQLYKYTLLQTTFGVHMLALVNNEPRALSLRRALQVYVEHRQVVIQRRSEYELEKARARAHILEGYLIALANLDDVIQTIRESPDADTAKLRLMERFKLTEIQSQAILDLQLRRLAALERQKIEDEHKEVLARIAFLEDLLANPRKILDVIKEDLAEVADKFSDERRTKITAEAREDFKEEDLVTDEAVLISISQRGYIKRVATTTFRTQLRGGRGVIGQNMREEDEIIMMIPASTLDTVLFFSDRGKVYAEKVYQIPDAGRTDRGISINNILALNSNEKITAAVNVSDFNASAFCTLVTLRGRVKRMKLSELSSVRPSGLIAINLNEKDQLGWAKLTSGKDELILVTANGNALRYSESQLRPMGRNAGGVTGIRLRAGDQLTGAEVVEKDADLLVVTELGFGKRTPLDEYAPKSRGGQGVATINQKSLPEIGKIAVARVVTKGDELTLISAGGIVMRMKADKISQTGRATRGVHLMDMEKGNKVASIARISRKDIPMPENGNGNGENGNGNGNSDNNGNGNSAES
ncbi:MAG: DNA gyrase subunit A [Anaerolinea sp.]|nr:DNA gyrase subunit A [Anaerolinea sp.]